MYDNTVITIGREFGSGGHEIGMKLAERLGVKCYDKELLQLAAKNSGLCEELFASQDEKPTNSFLYSLVMDTYSMGYSGSSYMDVPMNQKIFMAQYDCIKKLAEQESCIIVGRCADYVLQDLNPFRLFVYADISSKIARCREKGADAAAMTDKELQQKIISIDKKRARYYQFYTEQDWGNKANYDLCINTTNTEIKKIVAAIEKFIV